MKAWKFLAVAALTAAGIVPRYVLEDPVSYSPGYIYNGRFQGVWRLDPEDANAADPRLVGFEDLELRVTDRMRLWEPEHVPEHGFPIPTGTLARGTLAWNGVPSPFDLRSFEEDAPAGIYIHYTAEAEPPSVRRSDSFTIWMDTYVDDPMRDVLIVSFEGGPPGVGYTRVR